MRKERYAVIGHPIGHTMSPFIHSRLAALRGVQADYETLDIPPEALAGAAPDLRLLNGFNVTIPHKQAIIPLLDDLEKRAALLGSVNTVKNESGRLTGYSTDGAGFTMALRAAGVPLKGRVLILGAGGVARVMAFEAAAAGASSIEIATRAHSLPAARRLCADLERFLRGRQGGDPPCRLSCATFAETPAGPRDLLANGTPVGMYPRAGETPVEARIVEGCAAVFDTVYNPGETALLRLAARCGARAVGGMHMLVGQAAAAQGIWTGAAFRTEDLDAICAAASAEMNRKFCGS